MFGFMKKSGDLYALNQKLGRFLNDYCYTEIAPDGEFKREETRTRVGLPCILFPMSEATEPRCYAIGVTTDVSLHGLSMITTEAVEQGDYMLILGPKDRRLYLKAVCKRSEASDFGTYQLGFQLIKPLSHLDYPAIIGAVGMLESKAK